MKTTTGIFLAVLILHGLVSRTAEAQKPAIHIQPPEALLDEVIQLQLSGLPPKQTVTLRAQVDARSRLLHSHASFVADQDGKVDISKQAPVKGTYSTVDPMGLFWSMEPGKEPPPKERPAPFKVTDPRITRLQLEIDNTVVATAEIKRFRVMGGVQISDVRENGLVGMLFVPEKKGRHPAVLVLSGSQGGIDELEAALLASRGYTTLALAYFGMEGLPKELVKIPLEYLKQGIDWLKTRDSVDGNRIGVIGVSKGGELALLLGATFPEIKTVVAYVPSHVVWSGISEKVEDSSWSYKDKPLPYARTRSTPAFEAQLKGDKPVAVWELYQSGLQEEDRVRSAVIPVEKINGAILLISGKDDQMWPSALMAEKVIERLKEHKHPHPYQHLSYEGAGHGFGIVYVPTATSTTFGPLTLAMGGSAEANARAMADSRPKVLRFLRENLGE